MTVLLPRTLDEGLRCGGNYYSYIFLPKITSLVVASGENGADNEREMAILYGGICEGTLKRSKKKRRRG